MFTLHDSNIPFGLDFSDSNLKIVQLNKNKNKIKLQAIGKINLPKGSIENGEIVNAENVIKSITELINKPKFGIINSRDVVACLPETKTFIKLINIDNSPNKIEDIIENEIEKHVPIPISDMIYDWQIITRATNYTSVLIGAIEKKIINQYINVIKNAKLSISALEIEPVSICRCLLKQETKKYDGLYNKNFCVIDIGKKRSSITFYSKNTIVSSLSLPISSQNVTDNIAETLKINHEQAEKAKIICGLDKTQANGIIYNILLKMINKLIEKIKINIDYYNNSYSDYGNIDEILICGGGANIKKLPEIISNSLSIPTKLGDPFTHLDESVTKTISNLNKTHKLNISMFKKNKNKKTLSLKQNLSIEYTTAIGLALRNIFI